MTPFGKPVDQRIEKVVAHVTFLAHVQPSGEHEFSRRHQLCARNSIRSNGSMRPGMLLDSRSPQASAPAAR